ncbi:NAD(P)-dependent dehydrogenase (short-subunit alcohol dehydrogenase family) [Sphingobium sp. OAS761]|uniref:SDR family NAD(P)-dependent oxidoreductase n=1 Tax=Sphingobium sp. OAS761 TaxID=2817901 RepID=UPI00209EDDC1|nr:SDR family oxidoreductase [Sphingobium sp. OAS761]MCP1470375.1 NAD(P)-dependent dehydrogenase (short-subunit alcohol dehydrogenase family) [Sphingobium sp. OAS761]
MEPGRRFAGKSIIVTGGASGIGRATALRLAAEGGQVLAFDLNGDALAALADECPAIRVRTGSASDEDAVGAIVKDWAAEAGGIDVLVNMAGIIRSGHAADMSLDDFMRCVTVNLGSTFLMCRAALPYLEQARGNIVNAASTSSHFGHPFLTGYAASKGAVAAFTQSLAWEYLKRGVRVNAVAPGGIETPLAKSVQTGMVEGADWELYNHLSPINGFAPPDRIAGVIAMLASEDGAHMNGAIVRVDGGVHA